MGKTVPSAFFPSTVPLLTDHAFLTRGPMMLPVTIMVSGVIP